MKKVLLSCVLLTTATTTLTFAQNITAVKTYKIGYTDGYKTGYKAGIIAGYKKAVKVFKAIYKKKLLEYKEIEAGKILLKNYNISYPRVYQISTPYGSRLVVDGCKLERPVDNLIKYVPLISENQLNEQNSEPVNLNFPQQTMNNATNSSSANSSDNSNSSVSVVHKYQLIKLQVPDSYQTELQNLNYPFYRKTGSNVLNVYLQNPEEAKTLCEKVKCISEGTY